MSELSITVHRMSNETIQSWIWSPLSICPWLFMLGLTIHTHNLTPTQETKLLTTLVAQELPHLHLPCPLFASSLLMFAFICLDLPHLIMFKLSYWQFIHWHSYMFLSILLPMNETIYESHCSISQTRVKQELLLFKVKKFSKNEEYVYKFHFKKHWI